MRKKKKPSLLLTLGTTALIIGGGATAYWVMLQIQPSSDNLPVGANLIPQDALMTLSLSANANQWEQLREFGTPQTQASFDRTLAALRDRFLTSNGYNYQEDIQPWAGKEITLAFLSQPAPPKGKLTAKSSPSPSPEADENRQSVVMILPIDNPLQAKQILEKPNSPLNQANWVDRSYKGIQIKEIKQNTNEIYSATVLEQRFLAIATDSKSIDKVIDTYQGGASVAKTPGYAQALNKIKSDRPLAKLYVNIPLAALAAKNSAQQPLSPQGFAQLQQQQGLAATINLETEGIRFKSISWLKPNSEKKYTLKNNARIMPARLPKDTLMMISGGDLKLFWKEYVQGSEANPLTPFKPQELRRIVKSYTNLDLERDLVAWMGDEYSVSLIPFPQEEKEESTSTNLNTGLLFMVKASDRKLAEKNIAQLDSIVKDKYEFKVEQATVNNKQVINLTSPSLGVKITHGWLKDNVAFLALGSSITNAIVPQPQTTLAETELFRNTIPLELKPNNGHFFMDVDRLGTDTSANIFTILLRLSSEPSTQTILRNSIAPIRTIGVTTATSDERSTRFDLFVKLKKVRE